MDNISINTQKYFNIRYDIESQRIIIPIYNPIGEIIGIKGRANWEVTEDESKYLYLIKTSMSSTLYGYCQNYEYLCDDIIYVFEAEKSILQCHSYGIRNAVALGGNSLSITQCKLLLNLNPKCIVFLLDKGLPFENTEKNMKKIISYSKMRNIKLCYWKSEQSKLPNKASPSDFGKEILENVIQNELEVYYATEMECTE